MHKKASGGRRGQTIVLLLWLLSAAVAWRINAVAQVPLTTISDTVQHADGTAASGTVLVSWGTFTTASGQSVPKGSTSVVLGTGGNFSMALAPNAGALPVGAYYTAVYHLDDGSISREYWVVPVRSSPVTLSAIRTGVLPSNVATQTVSKQYVDQAISRAALSGVAPSDSSAYVLKTGDSMTGPLMLPGDPVTTLQAATKGYVDAGTAALQAGLSQKVSTVPATTQLVAQPAGTQLQVSNLNGVLNAKNFISSAGSDGIANALSSPDCSGGCTVTVDPTYNGTDAPSQHTDMTYVQDQRGGALAETFLNPVSRADGEATAHSVTATESTSAKDFLAAGHSTLNATAVSITQNAITGGNNFFPQDVGGPIPYFKNTYSASVTSGNNWTEGQHVLDIHGQFCYGVGDCLIGSQFLYGSGGQRDNADEGVHPYDISVNEDVQVFQGVCAAGCTTGSTRLTVNPTSSGGTQGEGRYLIDKAAGKIVSAGQLIGGGNSSLPHAFASFTGTAFPVSTFFTLASPAYAQTNNMSPGTLTMPIQTSGVRTGYSTNTASAPGASGVACIADAVGIGGHTGNFETASYTTVDGSHFAISFSRPHATGATLAIGGLCGYGAEQTVDTFNGIRQVFPVVGSLTSTSIYYEGIASAVLGSTGSSSAYANLNFAITSLQRANNVVTATTNGNLPADVNGLPLVISGSADASYNGTFAVTTTAGNQFTYSNAGADSSSAGATASYLTGSFVMYPMTEVRSVANPVTKSVDGTLILAPNTVAWATNDPLEQPHFFQQRIAADVTAVNQYTPRESLDQSAGIYYGGITGSGLYGWEISNQSAATNYYGNGGTHVTPSAAFRVTGPWTTALDMQAGDVNGIRVGCNSHGCGRWDSIYNLFSLQSSAGYDPVTFAPQTSTLGFNLRGTSYIMSPTGFTAPVINATTLNVTRINGSAVAASATVDATNAANITSGTLDPARLPAGYGGGGGSSVCSGTVAWSSSPTFAVTCSNEVFHMPLTGNVTSQAFTGLSAGDRITLVFQVGSTPGYIVQWSPAVHGGFLTSSTSGAAGYTQAGKYLVQTLVVDTDGATLLNPGAINE